MSPLLNRYVPEYFAVSTTTCAARESAAPAASVRQPHTITARKKTSGRLSIG